MVRLRRARTSWLRQNAYANDALLALVLCAGAFVPGLKSEGVVLGELPVRTINWVATVLLLAQSLPLAGRRRRPGATLLVVGVAFAADQLTGFPATFASLGFFVAVYSTAVHLRSHRREAAIAATAGYVILSVWLSLEGSPDRAVDFAAFALVPIACAAAGVWVRQRERAATARERASTAAATAQERARIARELHDVVTHHVTAIVVQADAAGFVIGEDAGVRDVLTTIADTGRRALAELRHQLDVLDNSDSATDSAPHGTVTAPADGDVSQLIARAARSGQQVSFDERGDGAGLDGATRLAIYRIVQESLTNAIKHAPGAASRVAVDYAPGEIAVEVVTDRPPRRLPARRAVGGSGRGLDGLRARVTALDGELVAAPESDGGFAVRARIPRATVPVP